MCTTSYSVTLSFVKSDAPLQPVQLKKASVNELRQKIPFYAALTQTHTIQLFDEADCLIESDDDLLTLFEDFDNQAVAIKVKTEERKPKEKRYGVALSFPSDHESFVTNRVTLKQPKLGQLKSHVPSYNVLSENHNVIFVDEQDREIVSNDHLKSLFDGVDIGIDDVNIKVLIVAKGKNKKKKKKKKKNAQPTASQSGNKAEYSVLLTFPNESHSNSKSVQLSKANIDELRSNIPFYDTLSQVHSIRLLDADDCEIESNDDLMTLFECFGKHDAVIKVVTEETDKEEEKHQLPNANMNKSISNAWICSGCQRKNEWITNSCLCGQIRPLTDNEWQCVHCTARNDGNDTKCSVCDQARNRNDNSMYNNNNNDNNTPSTKGDVVPSHTVFVYGISSTTTQQALRECLSIYGQIRRIHFESNMDPEAPNKAVAQFIMKKKLSSISSSSAPNHFLNHLTSAFVIFQDAQQADNCVKAGQSPTGHHFGCMMKTDYIRYGNIVTRTVGRIVRVDKPKKKGYLKPHLIGETTTDEDEQYDTEYSFNVAQCNGFDLWRIRIGTLVEYDVDTSTQRAVRISLYLLNYQWLTLDKVHNIWRPMSMQQSMRMDEEHKIDVCASRQDFRADDYFRTTRFQRTVKSITKHGGIVEVNYNDTKLKDVYIPFSVNEIQSDLKLSNKDEIVYQLQKQHHPKPMWKVVNIEFANLATYEWQQCSRSIPNASNWSNVPYRQNFVLEKRFNAYNQLQVTQIITAGKTRYRRLCEFSGQMTKSPTKTDVGTIRLVYDPLKGLAANIDVAYNVQQSFQINQTYIFKFVPNTPGLCGFKAVNIRPLNAPQPVIGVNHPSCKNVSNHVAKQKAILTVLPYRWQQKLADHEVQVEGDTQSAFNITDIDADSWRWCGYDESQQYERTYNPANQDVPDQYVVAGVFRRIKVTHILLVSSHVVCIVVFRIFTDTYIALSGSNCKGAA